MYDTKNGLGYVSRKQAVELMDISESTLTRWSKLQVIPKYKVRGRVYYKVSEIEDLIQTNQVIETI